MIDHDLYSYSPGDDPDGRRGKIFFSAVIEMERWEAVRSLVGWLLIVAGAPLWVMAAWPELMGGLARRVTLALWSSLLLVFVYAVIAAWRWRRVLAGFPARAPTVKSAAGDDGGAARAGAATPRAHLDESRAALLSNTSHELRTPLAVITGAATTLRDGAAVPDGERAELLVSICGEAERLDLAVSNVLDLMRLPAGSGTLAREWVTCEELIGAALARQETRLAGHAVDLRIPAQLPLLWVDAPLCERLLANLVDLAARRAPAGSEIDVSARSVPAGVEILVADRGPDPSAGRIESDLGFVVCSRIAQAHRGSVAVEPRETGGARFFATFPITEQPPAPPPETEGQ